MAKQIQTTKRNVPIEQIIAVQGKSPYAAPIQNISGLLGQAMMRKEELRRQGQQLAKLESLAGQNPGSFQGLDISTAQPLATKLIENRATSLNPKQYTALTSGDPNQLAEAYPNGIPRELASLASTSSSREENRVIRQQQIEALKAERELKHLENRNKEKTDIVNKFNSDPGVRKIQTSIDGANNVRELAVSGNPIAASAIPTYMARASGEVGNLSEADKAPFGGSRAILNRLNASLTQLATGQLTPENQKFLIDLADTMESSATRNLDRRAREVSGQYGQANQFLKPKEIYDTLRPIEVPKPRAITPAKIGKYKVISVEE